MGLLFPPEKVGEHEFFNEQEISSIKRFDMPKVILIIEALVSR